MVTLKAALLYHVDQFPDENDTPLSILRHISGGSRGMVAEDEVIIAGGQCRPGQPQRILTTMGAFSHRMSSW